MLIDALLNVLPLFAVCAMVLVLAERAERRRRARWWHAYFRGGGLARALIQRWNGPKRLTYRSDDRS